MTSKTFSRIFQIGGVFVFLSLVLLAILFAEGYRYDFDANKIVKKGVIYFEGVMQDAQLFIDGRKTVFSAPGGISFLPGKHKIEIKREGHVTWTRDVFLGADELIRFKKILLFPPGDFLKTAYVRTLDSTSSYRAEANSDKGLLLFNSKLNFTKFYPFNQPGVFWLQDIPFSFKSLANISKNKFLGVTNSGIVFYNADNNNIEIANDRPGHVSNITQAGGKNYSVGSGDVVELKTNDLPTNSNKISINSIFDLSTTSIDRITNIQKGSDYISFVVSGLFNFAVVTDFEGNKIHEEAGNAAYLEGKKLYYVLDGNLYIYDLTDKKREKKTEIGDILFFSRIGETAHFIFLDSNLNLFFCDEDGENNCRQLSKLDSRFIQASPDRLVFSATAGGHFILIDFREKLPFPQQLLQDIVRVLPSEHF